MSLPLSILYTNGLYQHDTTTCLNCFSIQVGIWRDPSFLSCLHNLFSVECPTKIKFHVHPTRNLSGRNPREETVLLQVNKYKSMWGFIYLYVCSLSSSRECPSLPTSVQVENKDVVCEVLQLISNLNNPVKVRHWDIPAEAFSHLILCVPLGQTVRDVPGEVTEKVSTTFSRPLSILWRLRTTRRVPVQIIQQEVYTGTLYWSQLITGEGEILIVLHTTLLWHRNELVTIALCHGVPVHYATLS